MLSLPYNLYISILLGPQYLVGTRFELEWETLPVKWEFGSLLILLEKQLPRIPTHKIGLDSKEVRLKVLLRLSIHVEQLPILIHVQGRPTHFHTHFQLIEIHKFTVGSILNLLHKIWKVHKKAQLFRWSWTWAMFIKHSISHSKSAKENCTLNSLNTSVHMYTKWASPFIAFTKNAFIGVAQLNDQQFSIIDDCHVNPLFQLLDWFTSLKSSWLRLDLNKNPFVPRNSNREKLALPTLPNFFTTNDDLVPLLAPSPLPCPSVHKTPLHHHHPQTLPSLSQNSRARKEMTLGNHSHYHERSTANGRPLFRGKKRRHNG